MAAGPYPPVHRPTVCSRALSGAAIWRRTVVADVWASHTYYVRLIPWAGAGRGLGVPLRDVIQTVPFCYKPHERTQHTHGHGCTVLAASLYFPKHGDVRCLRAHGSPLTLLSCSGAFSFMLTRNSPAMRQTNLMRVMLGPPLLLPPPLPLLPPAPLLSPPLLLLGIAVCAQRCLIFSQTICAFLSSSYMSSYRAATSAYSSAW